MFAPLAASIGFLPGCKTLSWEDGEATLEAIVAQVCVWEVEALQRTGKKKPGAMQGPQGMISGSVRKALKLLLSSVRDVRVWLKAEYNVDLHAEGVTFDRLLTLCVEIFFSKIRCGPTGSSATLMELQYRERRAALVESLLRERFSATGVNLFTSSTSYYPEPPAQVGLQRPKPHSIYPARLATSTQHPAPSGRERMWRRSCWPSPALRRAGTKAREGPQRGQLRLVDWMTNVRHSRDRRHGSRPCGRVRWTHRARDHLSKSHGRRSPWRPRKARCCSCFTLRTRPPTGGARSSKCTSSTEAAGLLRALGRPMSCSQVGKGAMFCGAHTLHSTMGKGQTAPGGSERSRCGGC
eukprot:scaffold17526_cov64-Phaeocystis_antarctica.AAC.4